MCLISSGKIHSCYICVFVFFEIYYPYEKPDYTRDIPPDTRRPLQKIYRVRQALRFCGGVGAMIHVEDSGQA